MSGLTRFLNRMVAFVAAVAVLAAVLAEPLSKAFLANPWLNGIIAAVLLLGIVYSFRQVLMLRPELAWLRAYRKGEPAAGHAPRLLRPLAAMLGDGVEQDGLRMTALSMRTLLDGVAARLEEGREISRYLTRLLVFLGLLGTFWGLLAVLAAIGDTIRGLSVETTDIGLMFDALKSGLGAPLNGMAVAFSSSLFGLAGSIVLGFLDLQSAQAQNRFYNDLEDWLSTVARVTSGGRLAAGEETDGVATGAYLNALVEQTAEGIERLTRTLESTESRRQESDEALLRLAEGLAALGERLRTDEAIGQRLAQAEAKTQALLERLGERLEAVAEVRLDEDSREHLRNIDLDMKRLIEAQSEAATWSMETLRSEIKLLARTLATALEQRRAAGGGDGAT
ncbi:MAG: flagellar motor protein MotA [Alphaproteobacteria bacterium]|nr:MAG: flagellar motor protein MotA [Alphaproteobacteria bacterium]